MKSDAAGREIPKKTLAAGMEGKRAIAPPPSLTVSEWAARYRVIPPPAAEPGRWRNERMPHLVEIMNAMGDLKTPRVIAMLGAQTGKSEACINAIGRFIHLDPCSIMMIQPTEDGGKKFSKNRIAPSVAATPELRERMPDPKTRDGDNTLMTKRFPGGFLMIVGSNAPAGLASTPIRVVFCDEVDRYEASAGTEGDPISLAEKRTTTFWNRKMIMVSTPGDELTSRIKPEYLASTMEQWHLPCPKCGHYQPLIWGGLIYAGHEQPVYLCEKCGRESAEHEWKSQQGKWVAKFPERTTRGFHTTGLVSNFISWAELADEWRKADEASKKGNNELLKTFINTRLAETWETPGERVEEDEALRLREPYVHLRANGEYVPCEAPDGALILTAGVDVQDDRLEVEVVGWGPNWESWGIEYRVIRGNPGAPEVWAALDEHLSRKWRCGDGTELGISVACVDSGGHHTSDVYNFTKPRQPRGIYAIKGQGGAGVPMINRVTKTNRAGAALFIIGVDEIKGKVLSALKVASPGPNRCHYPLERDIDDEYGRGYTPEYFKGLTSERRVVRYRKGFRCFEWVKLSGVRNEPLDCRVYACAALAILNPKPAHFAALAEARAKSAGRGTGGAAAQATPKKKRRGVINKGVSV